MTYYYEPWCPQPPEELDEYEERRREEEVERAIDERRNERLERV